MIRAAFLLAVAVCGALTGCDAACGYDACNPGIDGMINVHIVPHTHDDVGWLMSVDQYYVREVQYVLDSVVLALQQNPDRRFSYVEIAYFYRWWNQQADDVRRVVQGFVNNGQLSFILGGWCMNDEASAHYSAIIDQHTRGHQFLQTTFGTCGRPLVAWQIDPFGHSREQANLFAQMSYDAVYFARIDYQDYSQRSQNQNLEMIWKGSDDLGPSSDLFTGALYDESYGPTAPGVYWDIYGSNDPIQDDPRLHDYNVDAVVGGAIKSALEQAQVIRGNHQMWLMGSDFNYQNANTWFKNMDKLIHYTNLQQANGSKVNMFYSNPSCYTLAKSRSNLNWTTKSDDFFPYAHRAHGFWTGYFTSRAALKGMVRATNNYMQVVKQVDTWAQLGAERNSDYKLDVLKRAMGVVQHHDGVSGTEKQVVAYDYAERLSEGINACVDVLNDAYQVIMQINNNTIMLPEQQLCLLVNISTCSVSEQYNSFTIVVYNPIPRNVTSWLKVPVSGAAYSVFDSQMLPVVSQLQTVSPQTRAIPERNGSIAINELVFSVQLPALGYSTYFIRPGSSAHQSAVYQVKSPASKVNAINGDIIIKNEFLTLTFGGDSGLLSGITNAESGAEAMLTQSLMYYYGFQGNNSADQFVPSGAYLFRPNSTNAVSFGKSAKIEVVKGPLVQEVRQVFSPWASQVVRLYAGERYAEFEWTVGPIPFSDGIGREVISRFSSSLNTGGVFYTDANGRQILSRKRDFRPTWTLNQTEPVAGNYYPVNSRIFIRDAAQDIQLTVLNDRSQGGTSAHDGEVELMVHRVTINDDHLGVDEPLQEKGTDGKGLVVRGRHLLIFDKIANSQQLHRDRALKTFMAPLATFSNTTTEAQMQWLKNFATQGSALTTNLPANVHVLTAESWTAGNILLRLEHIYSEGEDPVLSVPVTVQLKGLFKPFKILGLTELTLSANQDLKTASRLPFNSADHYEGPSTAIPVRDFVVTLEPMQIRTFQIRIA